MQTFMQTWHDAAMTTIGLFWMALWAFGLGYLISSMIQVFVTRQRMKRSMGETGPKSVGLGTFFGFISSSCSFAALSTTRSLFAKGSGLVPALAFMLASTNLVIELGIIIAVFLSWQFVVGEYVGGILLILFMWIVVRATLPKRLEENAREHARRQTGDEGEEEDQDWRRLIVTKEGWLRVARRYVMEWDMVWKDVTIGFTVAGIIAAFVPQEFFQALFLSSTDAAPAFWQVVAQAVIGPVAAFFTFIGSMGNIPLASVLFSHGVSFAGVMAFIFFSDLVVFPVLRIQATYYGWKMALYILAVMLVTLVSSAVLMHYGFAALDMLPEAKVVGAITDRVFFEVNYTMFLNVFFLILSGVFLFWKMRTDEGGMDMEPSLGERILSGLSMAAYGWLGIGVVLPLFI
ncbi:permease [Salidesulfovibrio brasiliensis]